MKIKYIAHFQQKHNQYTNGMKHLASFLLSAIFLTSCYSNSYYNKAQQYREKGFNDKLCFSLYKKSAERGNAKAQYQLATMYFWGEGIAEDKILAEFWFTKAAKNGYIPAYWNLESMTKAPDKRYQWLKILAKKDYLFAQYKLAKLLMNGKRGFKKDKNEGLFWMKKAAANNYSKACIYLAEKWYYANINLTEARNLLLQDIETNGMTASQCFMLSLIYQKLRDYKHAKLYAEHSKQLFKRHKEADENLQLSVNNRTAEIESVDELIEEIKHNKEESQQNKISQPKSKLSPEECKKILLKLNNSELMLLLGAGNGNICSFFCIHSTGDFYYEIHSQRIILKLHSLGLVDGYTEIQAFLDKVKTKQVNDETIIIDQSSLPDNFDEIELLEFSYKLNAKGNAVFNYCIDYLLKSCKNLN